MQQATRASGRLRGWVRIVSEMPARAALALPRYFYDAVVTNVEARVEPNCKSASDHANAIPVPTIGLELDFRDSCR